MNKQTQDYHEVYGWMPTDIVNKISEIDRKRMFLNWLMKEPTEVGIFITTVVVKALGEDFLKYLLENIVAGIREDGEEPTREMLEETLETILNQFSTDQNILCQYVEMYCKDKGVDITKVDTNLKKVVNQPRDPKSGRFMRKETK